MTKIFFGRNRIAVLTLAMLLMVLLILTSCLPPTITPPPPTTPPPLTITPTPNPITYLIILPEQRAPVYTDWYQYIALDQSLHAGDAVPVRDSKNWSGYMWYECLVGHLDQFPVGTTGWVKFKSEKMYLEIRYP